jgi:beta-lactamase superfamily II metal-dependent hydrolase
MSREVDHNEPDKRDGPGHNQDGQDATRSSASPMLAHVASIQRLAGNAAVARLIARQTRQNRQPRRAAPPVQRQQVPPPAPAAGAATGGLDQAAKTALTAAGVTLSKEDEAALVGAFPGGVVIGPPKEVIAGLRFGERIDGYRLIAIAVKPKTQAVTPGVEAHIFQVGKGRSILVSSIGGGSVLFDAGAGQSTSVSAPSVQRLVQSIGAVTAGGTQVPQVIKLSHADADHYGAARALLQQAGFSRTAVEVAVQQLGPASGGKWTASSLVVQPAQRLVTVNVSGQGVQVNRMVIDNMELIEFRSVQAAQNLAQPGRRTFNRNASSPVVVVRDMVSGSRMLFTSDAQGHQFTEMVNAVGRDALGRILGSEGHNLKLMEAPHHFGKQAGPDATGMLNMLQLAYESGKGDLRLFAQTSQSFSTGASATYNFLESTGTAPERVTGDPSGAGRAQVTKATGSTLQQVTVDLAGVQLAIRTLQAEETTLRQAYERSAGIEQMRGEVVAMREALQVADAPKALQTSVASTEAGIVRQQSELRAAADNVWDQARAAAASAGEMSDRADPTPIRAALGQLGTRLTANTEDLTKVGNDLETHRTGLTLHSRLYMNAIVMVDALAREDVSKLYASRAEHTQLVAAAAGAFGPAVVDEHVRSAWAATRAEWPPERLEAAVRSASRVIASRQMSAEMRSYLAVSLANQGRLNEVVASAESGGRRAYGPGGTIVTPTSTKVGVGIFIALEVIRMGLELAVQVKQASDAAGARDAAAAVAGASTMNWWLRQGVTPTVALAKRSSWDHTKFNVVYEGADAKDVAVATPKPERVPDFDMIVVTSVDGAELRKLLVSLIAQLASLEDWTNLMGSNPAGPALQKAGNAWGVRVWNKAEQGYGYSPVTGLKDGAALAADLDRLYAAVQAGQAAKLTGAVPAEGASTIKDSAWWFGTDRFAWVYNQGGRLVKLNFGTAQPKFAVVAADAASNVRTGDNLTKVKAVDVATYEVVAPYYWVTGSGQLGMGAGGVTSEELNLEANSKGFAYVRSDHLVKPAKAP